MSVEIVRETKEPPSVLSQKLNMGDVFRIDDGDGDIDYYVVLNVDGGCLLFALDDLGNRWDDTPINTVGEAVEALKDSFTKSIEYFRQPGIDVKVTVGDSVKVL